MDNLTETLEEAADKARDKMKHARNKSTDRWAEKAEELDERWRQWSEDVTDYCRERPFQAIGLAAAAGVLAGVAAVKFFGRRESFVEHRINKAVTDGKQAWQQLKNGLEQTSHGLKSAVEALRG